jgi:DNA modification methylase
MRTKQRKLAELVDDEHNPRTHDARNLEAITSSLERFGQVEPIIVQAGTLKIIAGHGRKAALEAMGKTSAQVLELDLEDLDAKDLAIRLNRSGELAGWDRDRLGHILSELEGEGRARDLGFSTAELDELLIELEDLEDPGEIEDDEEEEDGIDLEELDEVPEAAAARVAEGETWELGPHRLYCGDSLEGDGLADFVGKGKAAAVVTDPPYAIYGSSTGIGADIADDRMVRPFFEKTAKAVRAVLKKFGHAYLFTDWRSWSALWEGARRAGLSPKNCLVWDKGGGGLGSSYMMTHEFVGFFASLPRDKAIMSNQETGQRLVNRPNILRFSRVSGAERLHNAAKPVELLKELIENSTEPGELVADPFMGSGSTLIACEISGRTFRGIDIEPKWVDVTIARWEAFTGGKAKKAAE